MHAAIRASKEFQTDTEGNFTRQRSLRRVLPAEPTANLFGRQNEDLNKIYKIYRQEYIILAEYKMIQSENIPGVYVIPSRESSFVWFGVVFVRSGPYEDGIFRFNIILDENFPESQHPKVIFQSEIIHPVIHPDTNELHLLEAFPTWNKNDQHLWQVLKYINWIFYNVNSSLAHTVNSEIADMCKNDLELFKEKVGEIVKVSQEHLYDEPPCEDNHYITFKPYDPEIHDAVRKSMLSPESEQNGVSKGHSWVLPGSYKPLGRSSSPDQEIDSES